MPRTIAIDAYPAITWAFGRKARQAADGRLACAPSSASGVRTEPQRRDHRDCQPSAPGQLHRPVVVLATPGASARSVPRDSRDEHATHSAQQGSGVLFGEAGLEPGGSGNRAVMDARVALVDLLEDILLCGKIPNAKPSQVEDHVRESALGAVRSGQVTCPEVEVGCHAKVVDRPVVDEPGLPLTKVQTSQRFPSLAEALADDLQPLLIFGQKRHDQVPQTRMPASASTVNRSAASTPSRDCAAARTETSTARPSIRSSGANAARACRKSTFPTIRTSRSLAGLSRPSTRLPWTKIATIFASAGSRSRMPRSMNARRRATSAYGLSGLGSYSAWPWRSTERAIPRRTSVRRAETVFV